jgi:putative ATPase
MTDLFSSSPAGDAARPLAERMRPTSIDEVIGQEHLTDPDQPIGRMVAAGRLQSIVLWGPPGTGKTSLARLLADLTGLRFVPISAVTTNAKEMKAVFSEAEMHAGTGRGTCLFVDEIHRLNKAQQDQFLGPMEAGHVTLVGCTTEHVAYELNDALLSRAKVLRLTALDDEALGRIMARVEKRIGSLRLTDEARQAVVKSANGDARHMVNQLEAIHEAKPEQPLSVEDLPSVLGVGLWRSDRDANHHYDRVSAFQKSVRGSDPDAALYWFAQMLEAGEDMKFILRRLTIMASEEVAMADPMALLVCAAARQSYDMLGSPEGEYAVAQAIVHVATAPKSNAVYKAYKAARALARETGDVYPPERIINHPTPRLARERGYRYDHDHDGAFSGQSFWPDSVGRRQVYTPSERGFESQIAKRLSHWNGLREPHDPPRKGEKP